MPVYYKALSSEFIRVVSLLKLDGGAISVTFDILRGLAVILTLFRLGFRWKIQRFWWEDWWAAVALLCAVVSSISALATFGTSKCFQSHKPKVDTKS